MENQTPEHDHTKELKFTQTLAKLQPSKIVRGGGSREPQFSAREITAIYETRKRHVSWKDIHSALQEQGLATNYTRASTLAQVVHENARKHGIEPFITVQRQLKESAE